MMPMSNYYQFATANPAVKERLTLEREERLTALQVAQQTVAGLANDKNYSPCDPHLGAAWRALEYAIARYTEMMEGSG